MGVLVVILIGAVFLGVRNKFVQLKKPGITIPTPSPITQQILQDSILVNSHTPAKMVVVDSATLSKPGFVAIEEIENGQMGTVLGASELLSADTHENLTVSLSRKTKEEDVLLAVIYLDNGDGVFTESDETAKDESGNPILAQFRVSNTRNGTIPATGLGEAE